jgi:hypothetical protein
MIMKHHFRAAFAALAVLLIAAGAPISITGQLLAYQDGYVFFTSGDGFRAASQIAILDDTTHKPSLRRPGPRDYARATFNDAGEIVELDLSTQPFPLEPLPDVVQKFVVAASTPYPNPDLAGPAGATMTRNGVAQTFSGKLVLVTITVQVPPATPLGAQVFMTTDTAQWNPQAIQLDRIDALPFRVTRRGLDVHPHQLIVTDADVRTVSDVVFNWADTMPGTSQAPQPGVIPTPYNPAPFPNLPPGQPTPHPRT